MKYASDEEVNGAFGRVTRKYATAIKNLERGGRVHMNMFTIDELMDIRYALGRQLDEKYLGLSATTPLLEKIQRAINSYCEHEYACVPDYTAAPITTNLGKCTPIIVRCKKCLMVFE